MAAPLGAPGFALFITAPLAMPTDLHLEVQQEALQEAPEVDAGHPGVAEVPGDHLHQPFDPHLLRVLVRVPQA